MVNEFQYMMLGRLQSDCEYFLGNGHGATKQLHQQSVSAQISEMKRIWNSLETKPEWLSMEEIEAYESKMTNFNSEVCQWCVATN